MTQPLHRELWIALLDLIYPPRCEVCNVLGPEAFCATCRTDMVLVEQPYCRVCGLILQPSAARIDTCVECRSTRRRHFDAARAVGLHAGGLRQAVLNFKFHNRRRLQQPLGELLATRIHAEAELPLATVDYLVPIPLHPARRQWRGFDQALYLSRELHERTGLPLLEGALVRTRHTTPQVQLTPDQREENVRGAFAPTSDALQGRNILLLDDVFTTGATANQAARAAKQGGAAHVYVLTLTRPAPAWHPAALSAEPGDA